MVKDIKRFGDSGGWGYAAFEFDVATGTFKPATTADKPPQGNDAKCGAACHTIVKNSRLCLHRTTGSAERETARAQSSRSDLGPSERWQRASRHRVAAYSTAGGPTRRSRAWD